MTDPVGRDLFDEDYLHFYYDLLGRRTEAEADLIARLLGLQGGEAVLDAPCGHGRIANVLAARGFAVTGLDYTELFLERARADATADVTYVQGDLRELDFRERFDAVVNWFSSFGYFDDAGNGRMLEGFRRALRPGGRLIVEQHHRDALIRRLTGDPPEHAFVVELGEDLMIDRVRYDAEAGRSETDRFVVRDGQLRKLHFSLRLPTFPELRGMLEAAGFARVEAFAEGGAPLTAASARMIVVAYV